MSADDALAEAHRALVGNDSAGAEEALRDAAVGDKRCAELLARLLLQSGRDDDARRLLAVNRFRYRLSSAVLRYGGADACAGGAEDAERYTCAVDGALPEDMLALMQDAFGERSAFWDEHGYRGWGPDPSPYFSYVHGLDGDPQSALDQVIRAVHRLVVGLFPQAAEARYAEWWAHCRPHYAGHQLHFDSDNEGEGGVRNPIVSTVLYLSGGDVGGPTLVTNQHFSGQRLATRGWMVRPAVNRLTAFDGTVLHGVIPGAMPAPSVDGRRTTFMIAFWKDVETRPLDDTKPCASQPFPTDADKTRFTWMRPLATARPGWDAAAAARAPQRVVPAAVDQVWAHVDPRGKRAVKDLTFLPPYDTIFQGF